METISTLWSLLENLYDQYFWYFIGGLIILFFTRFISSGVDPSKDRDQSFISNTPRGREIEKRIVDIESRLDVLDEVDDSSDDEEYERLVEELESLEDELDLMEE